MNAKSRRSHSCVRLLSDLGFPVSIRWENRVPFQISAAVLVCLLGSRTFADPGQPWLSKLPGEFQARVLWCADHEEGSLIDWDFGDPNVSGGGIFQTGSPGDAMAKATTDVAFSGSFSVETTIQNALRSANGSKSVWLTRWTDKPWKDNGTNFPDRAFFSVWMQLAETYDPRRSPDDKGWWSVFQFASKDAEGTSQVTWRLLLRQDQNTKAILPYLETKYNAPSVREAKASAIPVGEWLHLEACLLRSKAGKPDGQLQLWLNGEEIFAAENVVTCLEGSAQWSIGNKTDHIDGGRVPGSATVYFDDALVSTEPVHDLAKAALAARAARKK